MFGRVASLLSQPIHHVGYAVDHIPTAVEHWTRAGVGPFFALERMEFDEVTHYGQPCVFDHSNAIARFGDIFVELHEFFDLQPASLAAMLHPASSTSGVVNHISYFTERPEDDSAHLEKLCIPLVCVARIAGFEERMHWSPFLGHVVEIHMKHERLSEMFARVAEAAEQWDGRDPLRWKTTPGVIP